MRRKTVPTTGEERTTGMLEGSNGHDYRNTGQAGREGSPVTLILLLIRSKMRYAAAFFAVVLSTTAGAGETAWARAKGEAQPEKRVLYVNAPAVSVPQAREAALTADAYHDSDDPEVELALYWATGNGEPPAPEDVAVTRALASVGSPPTEPGSAVTPEDAEKAGQVYLAQVGVPADAGGAEGRQELADAGPVRPELGEGTVVSEDPEESAEGSPGGGEAPTGEIPYASQDDEPELAESPAPGPSSLFEDEGTADASIIDPYGFGVTSGSTPEPDADGGAPEIAETPDEPQIVDGRTTESSGDDMEEIALIGPIGDAGEETADSEDEGSTAYGPIGDTEQMPTSLAPSDEEPQDAVPTEDDPQDVPEDELADRGDYSEGEEPEHHYAMPAAGPPADDPEATSEDGSEETSEDELAQVEDPQHYAPPADDPGTVDEGADEVAQAEPPVEEDPGGQTDGENLPSGLGNKGSMETSSYQLVVVSQNGSTEAVENLSSTPDGAPPEGTDPENALSQQEDPVAIMDTPADPGATGEAGFQAPGRNPKGPPPPAGEEADGGSGPDGEAPQEGVPGEATPQGTPAADADGSSTGSTPEQGETAGGSNSPNDTVGNATSELVVSDPGGRNGTTAEEPTASTVTDEELASGQQVSDADLDVGDDVNHHSGPDVAADSPAEPDPTGGRAHDPDSGTQPAVEVVPSDEPPTQDGLSGNPPGEPTTERSGADDAASSDPPKNAGGRNDGDGEDRDPAVNPKDGHESRDPIEVVKRTDAGARIERIKDTDGGTQNQRAKQADGGQQGPRAGRGAELGIDGAPAGREEPAGGRGAGADHEVPSARQVEEAAAPTPRDPSGPNEGAGVRQGDRHPDRLPNIQEERRTEREAQRAAYLEQQRVERRAARRAESEAQQRAERLAEHQAAREAAAEEARQERVAQREAAREQDAHQQQLAAGQAAQEQAAAREQTAETQTYARPAPAVPRRNESIYQVPRQRPDPTPQVPAQHPEPAPQVPTRQPAPASAQAAAPAQQVQRDQHDGGVQANQLAKSVNRAAGR